MAGLSKKLTSLVQASEDPGLLVYAYSHLGVGVPPDSLSRPQGGFRTRVDNIRRQLIVKLLTGDFMKGPQNERGKERLLALQLFQKGTLSVTVRRLWAAKPEELRSLVSGNDPLVRFLAIQTIGRRRLHLESDLIQRLKDPQLVVRDAARLALIQVARGTDFGPYPGASLRGIDRSIEKWRQWLSLQQRASRETLAEGIAGTAGKQAKKPPLEMTQLILVQEDRPTHSPDAAKMSEDLVNAKDDEQMSILARLRDAKGFDNTDALALAIPRLSGNVKRQARDALTERLTRMTAPTLRDKLQDDSVEVRCAAALACGRKNTKEAIPDLLQLLDDPEMDVIQTARIVLTELSGKDFGPKSDADRRGCTEAAAAWRKWWKEGHHKSPQRR